MWVFKLIYKGKRISLSQETGVRAFCIPKEQPRFSPDISGSTSQQTGQQPEQRAQVSSQKEFSVFMQAEYSYLFLGYRPEGTQKGLKPGLRNNKIERKTSRRALDQYLLWRVGGNRGTPSVEHRCENGVCQQPLMVNSNCLLRGPTIPCWIPNRWRTVAVTLQRCHCFQNSTPFWPGWARSLLHANILPRLWFPHGSCRKDQEYTAHKYYDVDRDFFEPMCPEQGRF